MNKLELFRKAFECSILMRGRECVSFRVSAFLFPHISATLLCSGASEKEEDILNRNNIPESKIFKCV